MKKMTCLLILGFLWGACLPSAARAQSAATAYGVQATRPQTATPLSIAMIFSRLTGKMPDFEAWAQLTDAYQNADSFDQPTIMRAQAKELENMFHLWTPEEFIVVETPVRLSDYNFDNTGFFIRDFETSTFFPFHYDRQSYAVIPQGIADKQWMKVTDPATAKAIEGIAAGSKKRIVKMTVFLSPRYADAKEPASLGDKNYWLISAVVKKMMLYNANGDTLLWQSEDTGPKDERAEDLLNLYH